MVRLFFGLFRQAGNALDQSRNFGSRCFSLTRGRLALSFYQGDLLGLFFVLFRDARNALRQSSNLLPCRSYFVGGGLAFGIELICPAPKCDAFLVEPGNLCLSRRQCISVTCTNRWPDISSKHDAQSSGQNTNGYENCNVHVVFSDSTFECTPLINIQSFIPAPSKSGQYARSAH